jgi:hypothetical protein
MSTKVRHNGDKCISDYDINAYLESKGMKHANLGYGYLMEAIRHRIDNPTVTNVCLIYEDIADQNGTTAHRVERAIRHAIETSAITKIPNREFIAKAVDDLRYRGSDIVSSMMMEHFNLDPGYFKAALSDETARAGILL